MGQDVIRASTGIPRLDAALEGGVPRGTWVAVTGEPGTGKSILCMHFAWAGLKVGDPVIYVTTEAEFRDVIRQARQFKMYFDDYEVHYLGGRPPLRRPQLVVIDIFSLLKTARQLTASAEEVDRSRRYAALEIDVLIAAINEAYKILDLVSEARRSPRKHVRLIIDSMSAFWADRPAMARRYSYQLKIATHRENVTAFLVSQYAMTTKSLAGDEPIVVRVGDDVSELTIGEFVRRFMAGEFRGDTYVLSIDPESLTPAWGRVYAAYAHEDRRELLKVVLEGGGSVTVTRDHSIYTLRGGRAVPIQTAELRPGDVIPSITRGCGEAAVRLRRVARVEPLGRGGLVYDIGVERFENFVAGDSLVMAHNSTFGFGLEHIADGVIHLWMDDVEVAKEIRRYLIIKKMRMTNHYTRALRVNIVPGEGMKLDLI